MDVLQAEMSLARSASVVGSTHVADSLEAWRGSLTFSPCQFCVHGAVVAPPQLGCSFASLWNAARIGR